MYLLAYLESDFEDEDDESPVQKNVNNNKFTYKQMVKSGVVESEEQNGELPLAV